MYRTTVRRALCAGVSVLAIGQVSAVAQDDAAADTAVETEEVLVTAQRRQTRIQEVPSSVMAFGGEQLARERVENADALLAKVPGAFFATNINKNAPLFGIRGISSLLTAAGADVPVAFFVDDVYYANVADLNLDFYDVASAEILRGPQGTLFGRNVLAGAIVMNSKRPVFDSEYGVSLTAGTYNLKQAKGYLNGVIVDNVLTGRLSFNIKDVDGAFENATFTDRRVGDQSSASVRGQLLWQASADLEFLLVGDLTTERGTQNASKLVGPQPLLLPPLSSDVFKVDFGSPSDYEQDLGGAALHINWDTGAGTLTSVSAYRKTSMYADRDVDSSPLPIQYVRGSAENNQFTQEIRFASPTDQTFSYIVGAFFMQANALQTTHGEYDTLPGTLLAGAIPPGFRTYLRQQDVQTTSWAIFGELTYNITDQISLAVGARYSTDKKSGFSFARTDGQPIAALFADPSDTDFNGPYLVQQEDDWQAFTPRITLRYEPTDDINLYATIARGYQGGGFSNALSTLNGLATPFDPEFSTNYEVGAKMQFFDRALGVNISVYRQETEDYQVQSYNEFLQQIISNAGEVRQQGVEIESMWRVDDSLTLNLSYAYLDAKYTSFRVARGSTVTDFTGNALPYAPKHSLTLGGTYRWTLESGGEIAAHADYTHRSRMTLQDAANVPDNVTEQTVWNMVNADLTFISPSGEWEVTAWVKNLTDQEIIQTSFDLSSYWYTAAEYGAGARGWYSYYMPPRTIGLTLTFRR